MSREKNLIKNSAILSLGTIFPKAISVVMLPIITACLTKAEYGTFDLITTLVSLFLPIATLQLQAAAFRFLITVREDEEEKRTIISSIAGVTVLVCIVSLTILYFCMWKIDPAIRILIIVYFFTDTLLITLRQIARGLGRNLYYSISVLISSATELLLIVILLKGLHRTLDGVLWALILSQIIAILFVYFYCGVYKYTDFRYMQGAKLKELIQYSWPLVPNALSSWVVRVSDRLVLTYFMGLEATAIYAVANKIPSIFSVVQSTFSLAWQENASETVEDQDSGEYYGKMFDAIYSMMVGCLALLIASTPITFKVLIRGNYDSAYNHMSILYISVLFSTISTYLGGIYIAHMKSKEIGITTTIAAVINLVINLALVKWIGIYAATLSTVICYMWLTFYRMHDIQKIQKISFHYKKIIALILVLCCMAYACSLRIAAVDIVNCIAAIVLMVVLNRKVIRVVVKKLRKRK